ncbi:MAG: DUF5681 domain-containing protein [Verrucomicrobia bacterium]|nr:DUF5681 domain-containing protein [Verrucomicrobiota bacterium]
MRKNRSPATPQARRQRNKGNKAAVGLQRENNGGKKPGGCTGKGFKPGQSGNPSGKRKGVVSPTAALKRALSREDADRIAKAVIDLAAKGDPTALRVLFDRCDHPLGGPLAAALAAKSNPEVNGDGVVTFNVGVTEAELEATSGITVVHSPIDPAEVTGGPPKGPDAALLKQIIALCDLEEGTTIQRKGDAFIALPPKEPLDVQGFQGVARQLFGIAAPKGNGDGPVPAALALPAPPEPQPPAPQPAPAEPTAEPPASSPPSKPALERPAGSFSETDLLGSEAEQREQAEIRATPFRRRINSHRNPFL